MRKYEAAWNLLKEKLHVELVMPKAEHRRYLHGLRLESIRDHGYRFTLIDRDQHHRLLAFSVDTVLYVTIEIRDGTPPSYVPTVERIKRRAEVKSIASKKENAAVRGRRVR